MGSLINSKPILYNKAKLHPDNLYLEKLLYPLFTFFIKELNCYQIHSKRKDRNYNIWDYGEITLVSFLTHALRKLDPELKRFIFLQEVGLINENNEAAGRADLIIQDLNLNTAIILEAKKHYSFSYAPTKKIGKKNLY